MSIRSPSWGSYSRLHHDSEMTNRRSRREVSRRISQLAKGYRRVGHLSLLRSSPASWLVTGWWDYHYLHLQGIRCTQAVTHAKRVLKALTLNTKNTLHDTFGRLVYQSWRFVLYLRWLWALWTLFPLWSKLSQNLVKILSIFESKMKMDSNWHFTISYRRKWRSAATDAKVFDLKALSPLCPSVTWVCRHLMAPIDKRQKCRASTLLVHLLTDGLTLYVTSVGY